MCRHRAAVGSTSPCAKACAQAHTQAAHHRAPSMCAHMHAAPARTLPCAPARARRAAPALAPPRPRALRTPAAPLVPPRMSPLPHTAAHAGAGGGAGGCCRRRCCCACTARRPPHGCPPRSPPALVPAQRCGGAGYGSATGGGGAAGRGKTGSAGRHWHWSGTSGRQRGCGRSWRGARRCRRCRCAHRRDVSGACGWYLMGASALCVG